MHAAAHHRQQHKPTDSMDGFCCGCCCCLWLFFFSFSFIFPLFGTAMWALHEQRLFFVFKPHIYIHLIIILFSILSFYQFVSIVMKSKECNCFCCCYFITSICLCHIIGIILIEQNENKKKKITQNSHTNMHTPERHQQLCRHIYFSCGTHTVYRWSKHNRFSQNLSFYVIVPSSSDNLD